MVLQRSASLPNSSKFNGKQTTVPKYKGFLSVANDGTNATSLSFHNDLTDANANVASFLLKIQDAFQKAVGIPIVLSKDICLKQASDLAPLFSYEYSIPRKLQLVLESLKHIEGDIRFCTIIPDGKMDIFVVKLQRAQRDIQKMLSESQGVEIFPTVGVSGGSADVPDDDKTIIAKAFLISLFLTQLYDQI